MRRVRPSESGRAADAARAGPVGCAGARTRDGSVRAQRRLAGRAQGGGRIQGRGAVARRAAHRDGGDEPGHDQYHAAPRRPARRGRRRRGGGGDRVRLHRPRGARDADPGGDRPVSRAPSHRRPCADPGAGGRRGARRRGAGGGPAGALRARVSVRPYGVASPARHTVARQAHRARSARRGGFGRSRERRLYA